MCVFYSDENVLFQHISDICVHDFQLQPGHVSNFKHFCVAVIQQNTLSCTIFITSFLYFSDGTNKSPLYTPFSTVNLYLISLYALSAFEQLFHLLVFI